MNRLKKVDLKKYQQESPWGYVEFDECCYYSSIQNDFRHDLSKFLYESILLILIIECTQFSKLEIFFWKNSYNYLKTSVLYKLQDSSKNSTFLYICVPILIRVDTLSFFAKKKILVKIKSYFLRNRTMSHIELL